MPKDARPVLSVIVRRFRPEFEADIERTVGRLQHAVSGRPGFVGLQNSLSHGPDYCELVTVFAFDTREHLESWANSPLREGFIRELDGFTHETATHTQFGDLALLLNPRANLTKIETVAILIVWILVVGSALRHLADALLPGTLDPFWQNVLLVSVSVVLISYVFLPWSSMILTRLKVRVLGRRRNR